jgi:type IV secretory pathway VirB2 component (pilin)
MKLTTLNANARNAASVLNARIGRQRVIAATGALSLSLLSQSAHAAADFKDLTAFLQVFLNFMTGPFGKAVVIISIIAAFCTWVFAPREGIFGPILRVVVAGIAIMNAGVFFLQLGAGAPVTLS